MSIRNSANIDIFYTWFSVAQGHKNWAPLEDEINNSSKILWDKPDEVLKVGTYQN